MKNSNKIITSFLCASVIALCNSNMASAIVHQTFKEGAKIKAPISVSGNNRIEFGKFGIAEVIGDESKYELISDKDGSNLFIMPKVPVGTSFSVTLISSGGKVQDMELTSSNIADQTIIIDTKPSSYNMKATEAAEIGQMIRAMSKNQKGKYYIRNWNAQLDIRVPGIRVTKLATYQYQDLTGVILKVENLSTDSIRLNENDFSQIFSHTKVVSIGSSILTKKGKTNVLIVTREKGNV